MWKKKNQFWQNLRSHNKNIILSWISWGGEAAFRQHNLWRTVVQWENIWNEEKEDGGLQDRLKIDADAF